MNFAATTRMRWLTPKEQIMNLLLDRIYNGTYAPGAQLPDRDVLRQELACNMLTLQTAMAELKAQGQIVARSKQGTFVTQTPPCLNRLAILLPDGADKHDSIFIRRLAVNHVTNPSVPYRLFSHDMRFDVRQQAARAPVDGGDDALSHVRVGHYAGQLIPVESSSLWCNSLRMLQPERPWVGLAHQFDAATETAPPMHRIVMRWDLFLKRAVAYLMSRGRRHLVLVQSRRPTSTMGLTWRRILQEAGLPLHELSVIPAAPNADYALEFFMDFAGKQLKTRNLDGCVVADEIVTAQTVRAIQQTGLNTPNDVDIVSQATFPIVIPANAPRDNSPVSAVHRFGYNVDDAMDIVYRIVDAAPTAPTPPRSWELELHEYPGTAH